MSDVPSISAEKLRALTGLTDKVLRGLAAEGFFPAPARGVYQLTPTLVGLFRFYREQEKPDATDIYYDSLASCAAQLGLDISILKSAKKKGCPAFKGSRVYLFPLIKWMFSRPAGDQSQSNWGEVKLMNQALREGVKLKKESDKAADWDTVAFGLNRGMAMLFSSLDKLFSQTLPRDLRDLKEKDIKFKLAKHVEPLKASFRTELEKLGKLETEGDE